MDFANYLFDQDYLKSRASYSENFSSRLIFIENEKDQHFWTVIMGKELCKDFEFSMANGPGCSDNTSERGKFRFEDYYHKANENACFAVDSDFDHLTPNKAPRHNHLINNQFVFHTFVYSKESVINCIKNIENCINDYYYTEKSDFCIEHALTYISNVIKDIFICYIFLSDKSCVPYKDSVFHETVIPNIKEMEEIFIQGKSTDYEQRINDSHMELERIANNEDKIKTLDLLKLHGFNGSNCYLFINGHVLENRIIKPIQMKIKSKLINVEIEKIKEQGFNGTQLQDKIKEIKNSFESECKFETLRRISNEFMSENVAKLIVSQFDVLT
ncbi:DUF4435 domain-containing protein [Pseudoalteromonas sp. B530]|uniref:DUF4435 domain-containing protein n=1 Tax=Pseudoalteromonas sp. B530 TaxID=2994390 RepID=UPI00224B0E86|nr:DUF4435 domain-containing protein [Pseudoalteromonas sp. B530]MCX2768988.1 DUF4435 domain-containing protein [Pseudoalteromonas sp. B530]